jgi:hypothetical protein
MGYFNWTSFINQIVIHDKSVQHIRNVALLSHNAEHLCQHNPQTICMLLHGFYMNVQATLLVLRGPDSFQKELITVFKESVDAIGFFTAVDGQQRLGMILMNDTWLMMDQKYGLTEDFGPGMMNIGKGGTDMEFKLLRNQRKAGLCTCVTD